MKKTILCLTIVSILVLGVAIFAGCNENSDECVVTFITENGGKEVRYEKAVKAGALVTLQDFTSLQNGDSSVGHSVYTGFFRNSNCVFKFDDEEPIRHDTTLYVKQSPEGTPVLNFVLDGKTYPLAVERTKTVISFDFIASAYGKSAIPEQFDFFKDEQCTEKIDLTGFNYKSCTFDFWQKCTIYVKKHDVATVAFCIHNDGGECATTFDALVRTDENLNAQSLQEQYSAYTGGATLDFANAKLYSDATLNAEISSIGNLKTVHVNIG